MLYEPELWDGIQKRFQTLTVGEKGFDKTEGSIGEVHFILNLATAETTENFLVLTGVSQRRKDLETLEEFVSVLTEIFLPFAIYRAYRHNNSIIVLWGYISSLLEKKLQKALDDNPGSQRIEL